MKIVIAIDSFKGCLTSEEVENCVACALKRKFPRSEINTIPIANGGEGTLSTLMKGTKGKYITLQAHNPCMELISTHYGLSGDGSTAYIEMASISGLPLIPKEKQNPMKTTTFGTGELIKDALERGCTHFIVGIGGSATNDAGTGMLQALGFRFLSNDGKELGKGGEILERITFIDTTQKHPLLKNAHFIVACDVKSPFCGPQGASYVFARQKGANNTMIEELDKGMKSFSDIITRATGKNISHIPGSGAAGGTGGAFLAFLNSNLMSGGEILLRNTHFIEIIKDANLIITGEGKMDRQTLMGKIPYLILQAGKENNIPVIGITGKLENTEELLQAGFHQLIQITPDFIPLEEAMKPEVTQKNIEVQINSLSISFG